MTQSKKVIYFILHFILVHCIISLFIIYEFYVSLLIHAGGGSPTQSDAHIYTPFSMIFPFVYLLYSIFLFIIKQNYKAFVILFMFFYFMFIPTIAAMLDDGEILKTYKEMFIYEP